MRKTLIAVVLILGILSGMWAVAVRAQGAPSFSITPLQLSFGSSEPEIAFNGGFMAITSLSWLLPNGTQLWTGDFGATPNLQGAIDSALKKAGFAVVIGGGDASALDLRWSHNFGPFLEGHPHRSPQSRKELKNRRRFRLQDGFHYQLATRIHHCDRDRCLMNIQPNILFTVHEGAPL